MTVHILTTHKIPYSGSLHNRCHYLPQGHPFIPVKDRTAHCAPQYPLAHNPLRYKRQEDFQTNISHSYKTATSIAYTQSWDEYHKQLFSYYLYDHFGRPTETGQAKITHIRTGDQDKVLRMTNADIREHVHSLSNRINVLVATYNDADPFPACSHLPQDHRNDKIATIYYYPCIHAATPRGADGQYYPSGSWYAAEYHYNLYDIITTTGYQCTAQVQEQPKDDNSIAIQQHLPTADPISAASKQHPLTAVPVSHSYNCPLKNLSLDALTQRCSQVFNAMYYHQQIPPGSFAAGTPLPETATFFYYYPHNSVSPGKHYITCIHTVPNSPATTIAAEPPSAKIHYTIIAIVRLTGHNSWAIAISSTAQQWHPIVQASRLVWHR